MNANPIRSESNDREELARLLPGFVERELPSGRHHQLQEFVMSEIHQDLRTTEPAPRRSPMRRRVFLTSALTAAVAAVAAVAVAIGVGGSGGSGQHTVLPAPVALSGHDVLLAAATTAERQPAAVGTYWYVKTESRDAEKKVTAEWETWAQRDGDHWQRSAKTADKVIKEGHPARYSLGGPQMVSFAQLQELPTTPDGLKASITDAVNDWDHSDQQGKGPKGKDQKESRVFQTLISLVSQLPVSPQVRAAAFQAIAAYPNVKSLGPVEGGVGLQISFVGDSGDRSPARLVIDPATSQIRETSFFVFPEGAWYSVAEGGAITITAEWTAVLPE